MNLNQITLPVKNMPQAAAFYRASGFTQIVDARHYARFECSDGGSAFSLSLNDGDFNATTTPDDDEISVKRLIGFG